MNTNAVAYGKIWDAVKKKYKKSKVHKNNPNLFKGAKQSIHPKAQASAKLKIQNKVNKLKKKGKTYTKAQEMALKRKAEGKTISQVKASNKLKMQQRARDRHTAWKNKKKKK